jgi:hypothetical protein
MGTITYYDYVNKNAGGGGHIFGGFSTKMKHGIGAKVQAEKSFARVSKSNPPVRTGWLRTALPTVILLDSKTQTPDGCER